MTSDEKAKPEGHTAAAVAAAVVAQGPPSDAVMTDAATSSTPVKTEESKTDEAKKEEDTPAVKKEEEAASGSGDLPDDLPKNRFELELEFVQSLASPAYLHYLATNPSSDDHNWLDDPEFVEYLRYLLGVWSRPEYNRFLVYPQALYFLEWMLNHRREEWAQIGFRNFAHQQQFMSWQHRAAKLYGRGSTIPVPAVPPSENAEATVEGGPTLDPNTGLEVAQPEAMKEG